MVLIRVPYDHPLAQPRARLGGIDPDAARKVVNAVRAGTPLPLAAARAGCTPEQVLQWRREGNTNRTHAADGSVPLDDYGRFARDLARAEADRYDEIVGDIDASQSPNVKLRLLELHFGHVHEAMQAPAVPKQEQSSGERWGGADLLRQRIAMIIEEGGDDDEAD